MRTFNITIYIIRQFIDYMKEKKREIRNLIFYSEKQFTFIEKNAQINISRKIMVNIFYILSTT